MEVEEGLAHDDVEELPLDDGLKFGVLLVVCQVARSRVFFL